MVELVDTRDLKSLDHYGCTGSSPVPGTNEKGTDYFSQCLSRFEISHYFPIVSAMNAFIRG